MFDEEMINMLYDTNGVHILDRDLVGWLGLTCHFFFDLPSKQGYTETTLLSQL
jgi:hypothetical protein